MQLRLQHIISCDDRVTICYLFELHDISIHQSWTCGMLWFTYHLITSLVKIEYHYAIAYPLLCFLFGIKTPWSTVLLTYLSIFFVATRWHTLDCLKNLFIKPTLRNKFDLILKKYLKETMIFFYHISEIGFSFLYLLSFASFFIWVIIKLQLLI